MLFGRSLLSYLIKKTAKAHGFLDPAKVLARLNRFGQPSEVMAPTELLRSGALLHARGLVNSQALQHNLDWIWPYWVDRQFNPRDKAFVPRAFQLTHINLTNRNWTAVGLPDQPFTPIVDPRGLVTPLWDGWSIDCWIVDEPGDALYPSKLDDVKQELKYHKNLFVITESKLNGKNIISKVFVERQKHQIVCRMDLAGMSQKPGWLVVSLRPCNPEGVSFIDNIGQLNESQGWIVNKKDKILFSEKPDQHQFSEYRKGDVADHLFRKDDTDTVRCDVGMATSAALFKLKPGEFKEININVPLGSQERVKKDTIDSEKISSGWTEALHDHCKLDMADQHYTKLYETALRTLVLHTADEAFAGPYTYKRFWFRDAVFIVHALLCAGLKDRAWEVIKRFPFRQKSSGYFSSQEGEWDSNGQVLWILKRYTEMTGDNLDAKWKVIIQKGAQWIVRKRISSKKDELHSGLMPSGFSAEHLGPNDYYYWDNFWSVAGLQAASYFMKKFDEPALAKKYQAEADAMLQAIENSLKVVDRKLHLTSMPASPYRRMDSGAIGSLAVGYPLQLWDGKDKRLLQTARYLYENCFIHGGFFHDMSHSGINPYLTLHIAQIFLRADDIKFCDLMKTIAELASSTGQWPEAIHPGTRGGCMGDGQHVWAAAEWVAMVRNCFVREDKENSFLILCSGILPCWYAHQRKISFGPALTSFGKVHVSLTTREKDLIIEWQGEWYNKEPFVEIRLPGVKHIVVPSNSKNTVIVKLSGEHE